MTIFQMQDINARRGSIVTKLYALGERFPDEDLQAAFELIMAENKRRYDNTMRIIDDLADAMEREAH